MAARVLCLACAFPLIVFATAPIASADPITVRFEAFPAAGDLINTAPSTGFFTFDSSLIPSAQGQSQQVQNTSGLGATAISFFWGDTLWTTANADLGELRFGPSSELIGFVLGGMPQGFGIYGYTVSPAALVVDDIFISFFNGGGGISYTTAGEAGDRSGGLNTPDIESPVPEPSSILLLLTGAAVLGRFAWHRNGRLAP